MFKIALKSSRLTLRGNVRLMRPRALKQILQLPSAERLDAISEGLGLLVGRVESLGQDLAHLAEGEHPRAWNVIAASSQEEAAKALILLDLVRMDPQDSQGATRQLSYFYSHLARLIYVDVAEMRPADLAEVRSYVELMRRSHYLDGPNDVDWIFRNQLLARREESLYVDYVEDEEGPRWITPDAQDDLLFAYSAPIQDLVLSLHRVGCTSRAGLKVVADNWRRQRVEDSTHWQVVRELNRQVVEELTQQRLRLPEATSEDANRVIERWTFPLSGLELTQLEVSMQELEEQRARHVPW